MKEQNKVFFAEHGLTSSSAGHICTLCAQRAQVIESKLEGINMLDKEIEIVATGTKTTVSNGWSNDDITLIPEMLKEIGDYNTLQAWLKEAIKARDEANTEVGSTTFAMWKQKMGIEEEDEPVFKTDLERPVAPKDVKGEDILATWSVKDRNRLYELNSRAAVVGKYIGKDGAYTKARKAYLERHNNPVDTRGEGTDVTIYRYTPSVFDNTEQDMIASLENLHRSLNAELNGLMHKVEMEGRAKCAELTKQYEDCMSAYNTALARERDAFNVQHDKWLARHSELQNEYSKWKRDELEAIRSLKIVIPNDLKEIYEKVK